MAKALLLLVFAVVPALAVDYNLDWSQGTDYSSWASGKTIQVGDTVTFQYGTTLHTVDEVSQAGYASCSSSNPLSSQNDGNTKISLTQPGTRYFICGISGHCSGGMKIAIPVSAASNTPTTPPGTTSPTTPPGSNSPATPMTPKSPGAAAGLRPGKGSLVVGALLAGGLALLC